MELKTPDHLRAAISMGEWERAEVLLQQFREEVDSAWTAATPAERAFLAREVSATLEWSRWMTMSGREHSRKSLLHIVRRRAYLETSPSTQSGESEA
jgi:hypothetical protein